MENNILGTGPGNIELGGFIMTDHYEKDGAKYPHGCTEVLNHGFVRLVDVMGDDSAIVRAARVSYGKGTKQVSEDRGLIRYLMRHDHTTPFEMVEFLFHCRMPIFVARQWIRHRTASVNEYSGRYSEMPDLFYVPPTEKVTLQSQTNKQGGSAEMYEHPQDVIKLMEEEQKTVFDNYKGYLACDIRKELARINLPLSIYTEWYWKIDLKNLLHFLKLRLDSHAQYEIQVYGEAMAEMVKKIVPIAWEAFEDYALNAVKFSKSEFEMLGKLMLGMGGTSQEVIEELQDNEDFKTIIPNQREQAEFISKINKLRR